MAIQPAVRPASSSHVLRFQGNLQTQATPGAQTENAAVVQGALADVTTRVVFALADMTSLGDTSKRFPAAVFDDTLPVNAQSNIGGPSGIGGISDPSGPTWMQNVRVLAVENSPSTASSLLSRVDLLNPICQLDGAPGSGLGLEQNTATPCVSIGFHFTAAGIAALAGQGVPVIVEIEVPFSSVR